MKMTLPKLDSPYNSHAGFAPAARGPGIEQLTHRQVRALRRATRSIAVAANLKATAEALGKAAEGMKTMSGAVVRAMEATALFEGRVRSSRAVAELSQALAARRLPPFPRHRRRRSMRGK